MTVMDTIDASGTVWVDAGVTIDDLIRVGLPQGWFVPVTPGTRQVSVGGAIAADVHGKNHHIDGSFGHHVRAIVLATPSGTFTCSPTDHAELFWATIGGMGLTGIVLRAQLQLLAVTSDKVIVDTTRFANLESVMHEMQTGDHHYRYSVAWVDCMTTGATMGRAILTRGDHAVNSDVERQSPREAKIGVPFSAPSGLLNGLSIRAFNELWFRMAPKQRRGEEQSIGAFFHPLDGVRDWNRLYGRRGFVQYQFAVPDSASEAVVDAIKLLSESGVPSFLAVLKRFGEGTPGPLTFPMPGWTLALDLPVGPAALPRVLDLLDNLVLEAGGRVYLAKDARLDPATFRAMYPRYDELLQIKRSVDPDTVITSDLARRLELIRK
jgi:decaprenylphospho-beta-D-ribofuranose 2-oxidase